MSEEELKQIAEDVKKCRDCDLCNNRKNAVTGDGDCNVKIMVVGEAPGKEENETGKPFAGPAGKTFNELLAQTDVKREDCYITNRVKCRPPKNRFPKVKEITACQKYLDREIDAIKPSVILLVGKKAAELVSPDKMENIHGGEFSYKNVPAFVAYHPSGLNGTNADKRNEDFRKFGELVNKLGINK